MKPLAAALIIALAGAPAAAAPPRHAAPVARDWTTVAAMAPSGGFVLGNPAAKVKLVEYASFTCPHCAAFSSSAMAPLREGYIRTGRVSLEIRNATRDRVDLAVTLAARCGGAPRYFATSELLFARQQQWLPAAFSYDAAQGAPLGGAPSADALAAIVTGAGVDALLRSRGVPPARTTACLGDAGEQRRVAAMTADAWYQRQISGTPFFLVNGAAVSGLSWPAVEAALRDALAKP